MTRRSTLGDLAQNLGLSANTVSRALTGKDGVSARTRALVRDEATRIGYVSAGGGERQTPVSKVIAVAIPSSTHVFSSELIGAIEAGTRAAGFSLDLFITEESETQEAAIAATMTSADIAGAIVIPVQGSSEPWSAMLADGMPLVTVSREIPGLEADFVAVDSAFGEYTAVRHLLSQGCRSIVFFEEDLQISTIEKRRSGFESALAEVDGARSHIVTVPTRRFEPRDAAWRAEEAYRAALDLLDSSRQFDAIATGDDYFALGVSRALASRGVEVPRQVRVVGFGDHPYAPWLTPSLSSVRIPSRLIGELAVALLLQRIAGDSGAPVRRLLKPELVVRESSALT